MNKIMGSVGRGGKNNNADVKIVQGLLNQAAIPGAGRPLTVDGRIGPATNGRIELFQRRILNVMRPDGRVDPGGRTIGKLLELAKKASLGGPVVNNFQVSSKGLNLLKGIEGLRLKPYDDQTGKDISSWVAGATIGYGHLISQSEWPQYNKAISEAEAGALFIKDLRPFVNGVKPKLKVSLSQNQFDAVVILAFNIGLGNYASSSVLKLINDPTAHTSYRDLEAAWKAWNKSQGKEMKGLNNRRAAEWNIYSKNVYNRW